MHKVDITLLTWKAKSFSKHNYILGRRVGGSAGIPAVACKVGNDLATVP